MKLGDFQSRFQGFIENTAYKAKPRPDRAPVPDANRDADKDANRDTAGKAASTEAPPRPHKTLDFNSVSAQWKDFIAHLEESGKEILVSNLSVCTLTSMESSLGGNRLRITASKTFAYEMLAGEEFFLSEAATQFFGAPLYFDIRLDRTKAKITTEKTETERFQDIAATNIVLQFLITEFGAELDL